ncbi:hypothetical protein [Mastigocladopsis repens]|uniref:hypothetical protein n=1 Tax=Mastigocladopsis repens TaxID=221287 RepID=UPI0002DA6596|nr:hypothetical protein [Mastigocladopsis repens]
MKSELKNLTYEIELKPGEKLNLPESLLESVGAGHWIITIEQKAKEPVNTRSHDAFLKGYAPEDEGLYDDYPTR